MSSTPFDVPFDVYVFDFDGTLVDSASVKRNAFFAIFPKTCAPAVAAVLARDPDGSRYHVIPEMIAAAQGLGVDTIALDVERLSADYGRQVEQGVARAPAMPGAEAALRAASAYSAYVASMTPHDQLQDLLSRRGWLSLVREAFGYPHAKAQVVAHLLERHNIPAKRLLVVGDGISDREAAECNGCPFHAVTGRTSLLKIPGLRVENHV